MDGNRYLSGMKATVFGATLAEVAASFGMRMLRNAGRMTARERAGWLHDSSRLMLRRLGIDVIAEGTPPLSGLVVSNHLSYMDVLTYASLFPCLFVSKQEVAAWPVLGRLSNMAGTIYVDRDRSADNRSATDLMEQALHAQIPVVLFPEGTSTDGGTVLPFRSPFFEPAVQAGAMVTAAAIGYRSHTASEARLAYYGDAVFGPHLLHSLGQREVTARLVFAEAGRHFTDRKHAARAMQAEVEQMRTAIAPRPEGCSATSAIDLTLAG